MIQKTRGLVLSHIKYRETSLIVKIYTEEFGLQTYMVNGVRSSKSSKAKIALFQPLSLLDLVVYHKDGNTIHHIKEVKTSFVYQHIPYEHKKCVIAIFLSEILQKTIKEHYKNPELFDFLSSSLIKLDEQQNGFENFHLIFLLKYASFLGFAPQNSSSFFNELNSNYNQAEITFVENLFRIDAFIFEEKGSNQIRRYILDKIIYLYQIHVDSIGIIKSIDVLREIMD